MAPPDSQRYDFDNSPFSGGRSPTGARSPVQALFLLRLSKLLRDREEWVGRVGADDWRLKLLGKAIYSTFCDCVELGVAEDARSLFARNRPGSRG